MWDLVKVSRVCLTHLTLGTSWASREVLPHLSVRGFARVRRLYPLLGKNRGKVKKSSLIRKVRPFTSISKVLKTSTLWKCDIRPFQMSTTVPNFIITIEVSPSLSIYLQQFSSEGRKEMFMLKGNLKKF